MSSAEFTEWAAFYGLEPWGWEADNWRAGMIASVVANTVRDSKKRRKPFQPADFMPKERPDAPHRRAIDQDSLRAKLDSVMLAWGGRKPEAPIQ